MDTIKNGAEVHNRPRVLRAERGLSQNGLAVALGIDYRTLGYIERGQMEPSLSLAWRTAGLFELPLEEVFSPKHFAPMHRQIYGARLAGKGIGAGGSQGTGSERKDERLRDAWRLLWGRVARGRVLEEDTGDTGAGLRDPLAEGVPEREAALLLGRAWAGEEGRRLAADFAGEWGRKGLELAGEVTALDALGDYEAARAVAQRFLDGAVADFRADYGADGRALPGGVGRGEELFDCLTDAAHALRTVVVMRTGGMVEPAVLATMGRAGRARLAYAQALFAAGSLRLAFGNGLGARPRGAALGRMSPLSPYPAVDRTAREGACLAAIRLSQAVGVVEEAAEGSAGAGYEIIRTTPDGWRAFCDAAREVLAGPGLGGSAEAREEHAPGARRGGSRG